LTALANRRRFDEALQREWERAIHNQSPISLLMIDIDFFKAYNDRYGHPMGDECLRRVASAIAQTVTRPTDLSARYGGEEFACILSDTDMKGAVAVAQRILGAIRSLNLPHLLSTVADHVTVSIGVGTSTPADGQPYAQLIEAADRSLYRAKQNGRNQIRARGRRRGP
jgi:diguanylate cyclase (GGDEF)-like protein